MKSFVFFNKMKRLLIQKKKKRSFDGLLLMGSFNQVITLIHNNLYSIANPSISQVVKRMISSTNRLEV